MANKYFPKDKHQIMEKMELNDYLNDKLKKASKMAEDLNKSKNTKEDHCSDFY